jgi:hypothetical protein
MERIGSLHINKHSKERKTWKCRKGLLAPADAGLASYIEARFRRIIKFKNAIGAPPSFSEIVKSCLITGSNEETVENMLVRRSRERDQKR